MACDITSGFTLGCRDNSGGIKNIYILSGSITSIDEVSDGHGDAVMRGGVYIPTNSVQRAWRKGKVILAGPECKYVKKDEIVIFPNNLGVGIGNADISGHGKLKKGIFLNESRLFGIAKKKDENKSDES